jgi:hypothetical protein
MTSAWKMLIVDVSEIKLAGEAKQNNLPPKRGQPIDVVNLPINKRSPPLFLCHHIL